MQDFIGQLNPGPPKVDKVASVGRLTFFMDAAPQIIVVKMVRSSLISSVHTFSRRRSKMDELVKLVVNKTGISEPQAESAVKVVLDFIKDKLPEPYASQLDGLIAGDISADSIEDLTKGLGGLFGDK